MTSPSQCFSNKSSTKWVKHISNFEKKIKQETHLDTLPNRLTTLKIYLISSLRVQQYSVFSPTLFSFKQTPLLPPPPQKKKTWMKAVSPQSKSISTRPSYFSYFNSVSPWRVLCLNNLRSLQWYMRTWSNSTGFIINDACKDCSSREMD